MEEIRGDLEMSSIAKMFRASASSDSHIRPFDVRRDLAGVADLVEKCFFDTLDKDGERYLQQMRSAAQNKNLTHWASATADWASIPLTGYVWEEDGRLIGNLSLIPYYVAGRRFFLIANVCVLPEYRRRGIGRLLTIQGIEHARKQGAPAVWLHVREDNQPAVDLYRALNFVERARRTTWVSQKDVAVETIPPALTFGWPTGGVWDQQRRWLEINYPPELTWHLPLKMSLFNPGIRGFFARLFHQGEIHQWTVQRGKRLLGVLSWQANGAQSNTVWLAAPPETEDVAAQALLLYVRQKMGVRRPLSLDYPAHRAAQAIEGAGFTQHQTLIWMAVPFN